MCTYFAYPLFLSSFAASVTQSDFVNIYQMTSNELITTPHIKCNGFILLIEENSLLSFRLPNCISEMICHSYWRINNIKVSEKPILKKWISHSIIIDICILISTS